MLLLCVAWILPGLIGHAPWKGGDGDAFIQFWLAWRGETPAATVPTLYTWVAYATAWLTAPLLPLHDGVRLASGVFIALALVFVARAGRALAEDGAAWPVALTLLGCLGLLVRGHETNPYTAQFAAAALVFYALALLPRDVRGGWMLAAGSFLLVLAGGAAEAVVLLGLTLIMPALSPAWRTPGVRRAAWLGAGGGLALTIAWLAWLDMCGLPLVQALNAARWGFTPNGYFPGILGWFAWPAWPLAAWAVYRGRHHWRAPGILMPLAALVLLLTLYTFSADPGEEQGLILLLPLALLGGAGLLTLRRGAANALLWFAVMLFGFLGLVFWVYWSAHDFGVPARLAGRLARLGMADVGELRPWSLVFGVFVTFAWIVFLARVQRSPLRPMLVWTAGMTFIWVLLMALFLGPLDRRLGFETLAAELRQQVPADACVEAYALRAQASHLLAYHSGLDFRRVDAGCDWLLVQVRKRGTLPPVSSDWIRRAEIARPNNRDDRFVLYARR
ncbi:MAG: hypothetical protein AB1593_02570 [Pseudomonadota bacterium]